MAGRMYYKERILNKGSFKQKIVLVTASVFPDPVCAMPTMLDPLRAMGQP